MTTYVETDVLVALAKDDDWLGDRAADLVDTEDVVTSPLAYLELLLVFEREQFDFVRLVANLLEVVPVADDTDRQIVLKAVTYFADGMTPFDAYHAATAETRGLPIASSDRAYADADPEWVSLVPDDAE